MESQNTKAAPLLNFDLSQTQVDLSMSLDVNPQDEQGMTLLDEMTKYPFKVNR